MYLKNLFRVNFFELLQNLNHLFYQIIIYLNFAIHKINRVENIVIFVLQGLLLIVITKNFNF